jgi:hypothetical protein
MHRIGHHEINHNACTGQGTHGLSTDTRRAAGDDRFSPGQVDAGDDFSRRRLESKVGDEPCHCFDEDSSLRAPRRLNFVLGVARCDESRLPAA